MLKEERRSKEHVLNLEVYTDGSLKKISQNLTFGGWAFLVVKDSECIYGVSGHEENTTNQRMELTAIIKALEYASSVRRMNEKVVIYSDSAYIINCYLKDWYISWQKNNWHTASGKSVANQDLWEKIIPYFDNFWYSFKKVEAHAGVYWNEKCDEYAQSEAEKSKRRWNGESNV